MANTNTNHAIVRLDGMSGTTDGTLLVSARYFTDDSATVEGDIDNANIVALGDLLDGEREIRAAYTPKSSNTVAEIGLVASPEVIYDESVYHGLEEYYNEAGKAIRVYRFHNNDTFSATAEAFESVPTKGQYAVIGDTTKIAISDTAVANSTIGKIGEPEIVGNDIYYVVQVGL